jgi:hypothetical protein
VTIRRTLVLAMALPYVALCLYDLAHGRPRTGVSAGLLAAVNMILYWS